MSSPVSLTIGTVNVVISEHFTTTFFADGRRLDAAHVNVGALAEQQEQTAQHLGYIDARAMNREHDLVHHVLMCLLGFDCSPTLHAAALKQTFPQYALEESAVFAIVNLARILGIDLVQVAQRYAEMQQCLSQRKNRNCTEKSLDTCRTKANRSKKQKTSPTLP